MKRNNSLKSRALWAFGSLALLGISYGISRLLLPMAGFHSGELSMDMVTLFAILSLGLAISANSRPITIMTHAGYLGGFILAFIFHTERPPAPGVSCTNNLPTIWILAFLLCALAGVFWEIGYRANH